MTKTLHYISIYILYVEKKSPKTLDKVRGKGYICSRKENKMSNFMVVGGGWKDESKGGEPYVRLKMMTAIEPGMLLTMWKNKKKKSDKHPDFIVTAAVVVENEDKPDDFLE